nr:biliverdin-producing heme oxygenase [uncultured Rhodopila sp.]
MTTAGPAALDRTATPAAAPRSARFALREATRAVHARLHVHPVLGTVQAGTIELASYRVLLGRLYGFHVPFEAAAGIAPERSEWLADDMRTLGLTNAAIAALPLCASLPRLDTPHRRLGAQYVVEGSTLGGRELSKRLDHLFGPDVRAGRCFFSGRDADTGKAWRTFADGLDAAGEDPAACAEMIAAAVETFAAFETWLDWKAAGTHAER